MHLSPKELTCVYFLQLESFYLLILTQQLSKQDVVHSLGTAIHKPNSSLSTVESCLQDAVRVTVESIITHLRSLS